LRFPEHRVVSRCKLPDVKSRSVLPTAQIAPFSVAILGHISYTILNHVYSVTMIRTYLTLFRIPSVFSAMSNIWAGYFIAGGSISIDLLLGMLASCLIIMAGMALNDVADREVDAAERPERPIPSGKIRAKTAARVAYILMGLAIWIIGTVKLTAILPVILLCYNVHLYNFVLKQTKYGPLSMAMCRVFNLLVGIFLGLGSRSFLSSLTGLMLFALVSLGAYVFLVTYIARDEVKGNSPERVRVFMLGTLSWLLLWMCFWIYGGSGFNKVLGILVIVFHILFIYKSISELIQNPDAKNTRRLVTLMLVSMPVVDVYNLLLNGVGIFYAFVPLALLFLAKFTGKKFYAT